MNQFDVPVFDVSFPVRGRLFCFFRVKLPLAGDVIHILDLDGDVSLTNAMGPELQAAVLDRLVKSGFRSETAPGFRYWVLYHTDSVVSTFAGSFGPAPAELWDAAMAAEMYRLYGEGGRY